MPASLRCFDVSPEPAANRLLRALAVVLERFGGRWYVFGAQAVIVWGQPRLTAAVDVTCFLEPEDPEAFVTSMKEADFSLRVRDVVGFVLRTRVLPFVHGPTQLALDVVLAGPGLEEEFLRTAKPVDFEGTRIPVIGAEELIVTKLLAGRPKDLDDVHDILRAQEGIALPLLRQDLENLKTSYQRDIDSSKRETDRMYDQNKWFIGLMFSMAIGLIGLAISNFVQARRRPD